MAASASDVQALQVRLELGQVRARKRDVIEGIDDARGAHFIRPRLREMQHGVRPRIEPVAEAVERRPVTGLQTDHRHVEVTQRVERGAVRAQIVVIESGDWHDVAALL